VYIYKLTYYMIDNFTKQSVFINTRFTNVCSLCVLFQRWFLAHKCVYYISCVFGAARTLSQCHVLNNYNVFYDTCVIIYSTVPCANTVTCIIFRKKLIKNRFIEPLLKNCTHSRVHATTRRLL